MAAFALPGSFESWLSRVPAAFAMTEGESHTLVFGNDALRTLLVHDALPFGRPITDLLPAAERVAFRVVLDRVFRSGAAARDRRIVSSREDRAPLSCTVWPDGDRHDVPRHLLIEVRASAHREPALSVQREIAERLLLRALRDQDAVELAERSRRDAAFLAAEGRRLADSLDEQATLNAMTRMALPDAGGWCIVDMLGDLDSMTRLPIVHPDKPTQAMLDALGGRWLPFPGDPFGLPAVLTNGRSSVIAPADVWATLVGSARELDVQRALRTITAGPMLTVPLVTRRRLVGAVTFFGGQRNRAFTVDDIELAEDLASRSATALERARAYGQEVALKETAVSANDAKTTFLGMMSHELRTPLNAIGGYVELMALGVHGPLTDEQRMDLTRIRTNQRYLMGLISDMLNLTRVTTGHVSYDVSDLVAHEVLTSSIALIHPLIAQKGLTFDGLACDVSVVARGDHEKVIQILVNLLSNAIKFTPSGGALVIDYATTNDVVQLRVCDTGIGIPTEKLDVIFDPFVQVNSGTTGQAGGVGLGLAISRSLARGMNGDLTVESTIDQGARFTLTLPRPAGGAPLAAVS